MLYWFEKTKQGGFFSSSIFLPLAFSLLLYKTMLELSTVRTNPENLWKHNGWDFNIKRCKTSPEILHGNPTQNGNHFLKGDWPKQKGSRNKTATTTEQCCPIQRLSPPKQREETEAKKPSPGSRFAKHKNARDTLCLAQSVPGTMHTWLFFVI